METEQPELEQQIASVAALGEPVRRSVYQTVSARAGWVSRDEAAEAVGISRSLAAFHLDKLVDGGLLEAGYERRTGRTGPGAGRPSKIYRRSQRQFAINLPPRSYELAAHLLVRSVERLGSDEALEMLDAAAGEFGEHLAAEARLLAGPHASEESMMQAAEELLATYGYEPHHMPDGTIRLRNCPFHALAQTHRTVVCGMNHALMTGLVTGLGSAGIEAVLDPQPGLCCVAFRHKEP
ncbi:MAG TPA: helix-turn-helix domain-containing protein [Chloroflexota bacterium]